MPDDPLAPFATRYAPRGMVCSIDHLASGAGVAMLRAGGTAADAAVATSAVLAVTSQHLCGMGGDLFALVHAGTGPPAALNASGRAGSGADPERLRAAGATAMPFQGDVASVPVPGCVDGWLALHARFGRLPLAEVVGPAAGYAEDGFPASPTLAALVPLVADLPGAADYTAAGPVRPGTAIRRPGLARAMRELGAAGDRDAWYGGDFGQGLVDLGAGEYTPDDLAPPLADWVEPLGLGLWGADVWTIPPNSQGYLTLAGAWIAEGLDLPVDPDDALWAHLLVEAARQAGHDRPAVLWEGADGHGLVDPGRLTPRRAAVDPERVAGLGPAEAYAPGGTIHLAAVDGERMGVSLIQSNAFGWGANLVVPGVRVFLHNRGIGFSLAPGHPAEYGPRRRPPSTLAPALVTDGGGRLVAVVGTMGGDSQPQILLQLLARLLHHRQRPGPAVAAGRWVLAGGGSFATWAGGGDVRVQVEGHAPPAWAEGLAARGHPVERAAPFDHGFGHAHAIVVDGDVLAGAADPRPRTGSAAGH
jgi:gamma-glutamyltranspeptidase/glutathione hydrolase